MRSELHPKHVNDTLYIPPACYTLSKAQIKGLLEFFFSVKFPDGYASNISSCVSLDDCLLTRLKSHDCHVLLQRILSIGLRGYLRKDVLKTLSELSSFFKQLASKTLNMENLKQMKNNITMVLCNLEKNFPPAFFDVMIHLSIHLAEEALVGGPVHYRWMYPFERFMKSLKEYIRNKTHREGCIAEGYIDNECTSFWSMYFDDMNTKFNRLERNHDGNSPITNSTGVSIFGQKVRGFGAKREHKEELYRDNNQNVERRHRSEFQEWLLKRVTQQWKEGCQVVTENLLHLAEGPDQRVYRHRGCVINGLRFRSEESENHLRSSVKKRTRERTRGIDLAKHRVAGEKIKLGWSKKIGRPISKCRKRLNWFSTEVGIAARKAKMDVVDLKHVPDDSKMKFDLPTDKYVNEGILRIMGSRFSDYLSRLKKRFESHVTVEEAIADKTKHIKNQDYWDFMCKLWQDKEYLGKCEKYKANKSKQPHKHCAGSSAFYKANVPFLEEVHNEDQEEIEELDENDEQEENNEFEPDLVEIWLKTHYNTKKGAWFDEESKLIYEKLKIAKEKAILEGKSFNS